MKRATSRPWLAGGMAVALVLMATALLSADRKTTHAAGEVPTPIPAGYDLFTTLAGLLQFDSGVGLTLPGDFFGPGSLTPSGPVDLVGVPIGGVLGETDTVVQRLTEVSPVDIQIVALNLTSVAPLVVPFEDGSTQLWDVAVSLSPAPSAGTLDVFPTSPSGGFLGIQIDFFPEFTFSRVGGTDVLAFDSAAAPDRFPLTIGSTAFYSTECPNALQVDDRDTGIVTTPGFCPGTDPDTGITSPISLYDISGMFGAGVVRTQTPSSSITIIKDSQPDDAQNFAFTGDLGEFFLDDDADPALSRELTRTELGAGVYEVAEAAHDGWRLVGLSCEDPSGDSNVDLNAEIVTIRLGPDEHVTCTFVNEELGSITIVKDARPDDPRDFAFDGSFGPFLLDDDPASELQGSRTFDNLSQGAYTVNELFDAGWRLTEIDCIDPTGDTTVDLTGRRADIQLAPGEDVTCFFINVGLGSITVIKDAAPDDHQDFTFSGTLGQFSLDDDADPALARSRTVAELSPGHYVVTEAPVDGWNLTSIDCADPTGDSTVDVPSRTANIQLALGEHVVCTFTNVRPGSITVVKDSAPDDPQDFQFSGGLGSFLLDNDDDVTLPAAKTVSDLGPGIYVITEAPVEGWVLAGIECVDPAGGAQVDLETGTVAVALSPGEDVTCTFRNVKLGSITIQKDAIPDSAQEFQFTGDLGSFLLSDDYNGAVPRKFTLPPGEYSITEQSVSGWSLESILCEASSWTSNTGARTVTVQLSAGEDVLCVFANVRQKSGRGPRLGSITIDKFVLSLVEPDFRDPQDFTFTGSFGTFVLDDDRDPTLSNSVTFPDLPPGRYEVTEQPVEGWRLRLISCLRSEGDSPRGTLRDPNTLVVLLSPGVDIRCAFQNEKLPTTDLEMAAKTGPEGNLLVGDSFTWVLGVVNNGPNDATNVVVHDPMPLGVRSTNTTLTVTDADDNVIRQEGCRLPCNVGTLPPGGAVTIEVEAVAVRSGSYTNTARVTSDNDATPENNEQSASVTILNRSPKADVELVSKTSLPAEVKVGKDFVYRVHFRVNQVSPAARSDRALSVEIFDAIPAGMQVVSIHLEDLLGNKQDLAPPDGCQFSLFPHRPSAVTGGGGSVECRFASLPVGYERVLVITGRFNVAGEVTNTVTITALNDVDASNNEKSLTHVVQPE